MALPSFSYSWEDRYRPRKPRYINKVKTGFDWSKYNRTHYDKDTPPPKVVQVCSNSRSHVFFTPAFPLVIDPSCSCHHNSYCSFPLICHLYRAIDSISSILISLNLMSLPRSRSCLILRATTITASFASLQVLHTKMLPLKS